MAETTVQYFYKPGFGRSQVLWLKKRVKARRYDFTLSMYRDHTYEIERKATASEAASILPILNVGLPAS